MKPQVQTQAEGKIKRLQSEYGLQKSVGAEGVERIYNVVASAYAPHDKNAKKGMCHDGNPSKTYTETYPTPGRTLAVDPNVIPLGSKVLIEGFEGEFIAEDIGGLIRGYAIDICMETQEEALAWGKQEIKIIVVE